MARDFPGARQEEGQLSAACSELQQYFSGKKLRFTCGLDFAAATEFQKKVWKAARQIAYGQVRTYGWLAEKIGCPEGSRAVGAALGKNPFPLIIPCHRVIRQGGGLGGFSATEGIALKKKLLQLEGALK
jgi:O-6-methylguanine DNA methyltransferase